MGCRGWLTKRASRASTVLAIRRGSCYAAEGRSGVFYMKGYEADWDWND